MSSKGKRERVLQGSIEIPNLATDVVKSKSTRTSTKLFPEGIQFTESVSNRYDRNKGHYVSGGPFFTSRVEYFVNPTHISGVTMQFPDGKDYFYSGPAYPSFPTGSELFALGFEAKMGPNVSDSLKAKGPTAIAITSPTNKTSNLAIQLGELMRDGLPSLYGVQTWKQRTLRAKSAGDEYLNHVFGWQPLVSEVKEIGNAARHSRDIMKQYQEGEGRNIHRRFDFPSTSSSSRKVLGLGYAQEGPGHPEFLYTDLEAAERRLTRVRKSRCWFEGCYTYGGPSKADSFQRHLGYGSQADHLFGLTLTPEVLWELTPWSWAIDWFSNAGDNIKNITNFGLAGLVMRYGFVMQENIDEFSVEVPFTYFKKLKGKTSAEGYTYVKSGPASCGVRTVTKCRAAASPFGFSIGWEGLSPTQLAITAALGISKWL